MREPSKKNRSHASQMSDMATVFVSGIRSLDADALLSAFNMESSLLDANINAIASLFNRELHFINVNDEDYVRLVCDARSTGERWKARTRDMKGQFCRTKYQANVVWGWSHRIYDWTVVLPWSFGQMLAPLAAQINSVACKDTHNLRRKGCEQLAKAPGKHDRPVVDAVRPAPHHVGPVL